MIKINLATSTVSPSVGASLGISSDGFVSPDEARKEALKRLVLLLVGPAALYIYENQNIPGKIADLNAKTQVLSELQSYNSRQAASVAEIKKFKEDEALMAARISALEKLAKDRQREVRVLDLLQSVIPEKAWLTRVQINPDRVNIQGLALSDFEVSAFLEALTKSVFLMDVNLVSSSEVTQDGSVLKKFEISCLLERPE
ncbi:PilN domain-containing protein [Bdellovibrio bacteriovorus]|uniref:Fimbrial assembly protein n=1 Tax=Bdellovibrio bacteriovorus TaxID=959 RepID=A0A150WIP7_BDEBC|nr:PilN domain-containing protein [Bdellovibrio bacteriovorus]KYG61374.1 fimbrial assembly protein [Bdellovibrio bacteriovorus]KYG63506.1 fimbrial assembly protein [Bdellovibrio bacteriovorus]